MRWLQRAPLLMLFMTVLHAGTAAAQSTPAAMGTPSADVVKQADALFQEANRLVGQKKWAEAEAKLLQAQALNPSFDITTNLGHTQARLGKHRQAATNLARALRNWPVIGAMASKRAIAVKQLDEVRPFVAEVSVTVNIADAAIFVDGERVGISPMKETIFLDPGPHKIEAALAGYERATQKIEATKGAMPTVSLSLKPSAAAKAVAEPSKAEPLTTAQQETKQPEIKSQPVKAQPVTPQPIKPDPTPQGSKLPVRAIVIAAGAGASAILIGTGAAFTIVANNRASDAAGLREPLEKESGAGVCRISGQTTPSCKQLHATLDEQSHAANVALGTFIAGGVAGVGTLVFALVTLRKPERAAMEVLPVVSTSDTGLVVRGRW